MQLSELHAYEGKAVAVVLSFDGRQVLAVGRLSIPEPKRERPDGEVLLAPLEGKWLAVINGPGLIPARRILRARPVSS